MDIRQGVEMPVATRDGKYAEKAAQMVIDDVVMFPKKNEALTLQRAMVPLKRAGRVRQMPADHPQHAGQWGCWLVGINVEPRKKSAPAPATPPAPAA